MQELFKIYGFGGTGISQVASHKSSAINKVSAFADTSDSDSSSFDIEPYFFHAPKRAGAPDTDGGGKDRGLNIDVIRPQIPAFIKQHPLGRFNVFVSSDCGGTGPVIVHLMVQYCIENNIPYVVIWTGNQSCLRETSNAVKAFEGLDALAQHFGVGIPFIYQNNSKEGCSASKNDETVHRILDRLELMFNNSFTRLDTQDKINFLNPHNHTSFNGGLIELSCVEGKIDPAAYNGGIFSTLSLITTLDETPEVESAEYAAVGTTDTIESPIHLLLSTNNIIGLFSFVEEGNERRIKERDARAHNTHGGFRKQPSAKPAGSVDDLLSL